MLDGEVCMCVDVANCLGEKKAEGAAVDAPTVWRRCRDGLDGTVHGEWVSEGNEIVVGEGGEVWKAGVIAHAWQDFGDLRAGVTRCGRHSFNRNMYLAHGKTLAHPPGTLQP